MLSAGSRFALRATRNSRPSVATRRAGMIRVVGEITSEAVEPGAAGIPHAQTASPIRALFVCTANICRSAYAETVARHLLGDREDLVFASAGTHGLTAQPINPDIAVYLPDGAEPAGFASRRVTRELVENADLVLTAEASHRTFLIEEFPRAFRKVLTLGQFAEAARGSELRGRELIAAVGRQQPPMRPEHDVRDPYRRGRAANAEAAARINELLATVVPGLTGEAPPPVP